MLKTDSYHHLKRKQVHHQDLKTSGSPPQNLNHDKFKPFNIKHGKKKTISYETILPMRFKKQANLGYKLMRNNFTSA